MRRVAGAGLSGLKRLARARVVAPAGTRPMTMLNGTNAVYVEEMHRAWSADAASVHASWDAYFRTGQFSVAPSSGIAFSEGTMSAAAGGGTAAAGRDLLPVTQLVHAFQKRGHEIAALDPLGLQEVQATKGLDPATFGFTEADWDRPLELGSTAALKAFSGILGEESDVGAHATLRELVGFLKKSYSGSVGVEFMHIRSLSKLNWVRARFEGEAAHAPLSKERRAETLGRLANAELFESFLATKFNTAKRFGMEGLESVVPGMLSMIDAASDVGVDKVVIGMPHRGRLNVLQGVMSKPLEMIFKEFKGTAAPDAETAGGDADWSGAWWKTAVMTFHAHPSHNVTCTSR